MSDLKYQDITESLSIVKKQALEEQRGSLQPVAVRGKNPSGVNFPKPPGRGGTPRDSAIGAINRAGKGHGKVTKPKSSKGRDDQPVSGAINDMVDSIADGQNYPATAAVAGSIGVGGGAVISDRMKPRPPYGNEFDIQEQDIGDNQMYENQNKKELNAVVEALRQIYEMNDKEEELEEQEGEEEELEEQEGEEEELEESPLVAAAITAPVAAYNATAPIRMGYAAAEAARLGSKTRVGQKIGSAAMNAVRRVSGTPTRPRGMTKGPSRRGGRPDTSRPSGMQK